jgi:hypothetical protein
MKAGLLTFPYNGPTFQRKAGPPFPFTDPTMSRQLAIRENSEKGIPEGKCVDSTSES